MIKFAYNLVRLALFLLALAFLSFYLRAEKGMNMEALDAVVENATKYLPVALIPVTIAMAVLLLLRWMSKDKDEAVGFEDFFAGVLALALQVAILVIWRAQGNEIAGELSMNIPDVQQLTVHADKLGTIGVAGLEFVAFVLYVIAGPDKRERKA